ncbi:MAG: isoprenylcysteine carboxylmethyltransferase family protein [Pseudomonadota bacterium]
MSLELKVPPPVVAMVSAFAIWGLAQSVPELAVNVPGQRLVGGLVALCGLLLGFVALGLFKRYNTTFTPVAPQKSSALVTTGIYRMTRNPMYLGLAVILLGWTIALGTIAGLFLIAGFVAYITRFQIVPEEAALRQIFGEDFTAYCRRVRRWL